MRASRIRLVEIVVAISVVAISVASLGVALFQGHVMQRALEAQVLPVVQYRHSNFDGERQAWRMEFRLMNTGLGPAEVRWSEIRWRGIVLSEPAELMVRCCVPADIPADQRYRYVQQVFQTGHMRIYFEPFNGRFFAPQEEISFIDFPRPDAALSQEAFDIWMGLDEVRHEIEVDLCYCSVFDDCWVARFPEQSREPVRACPVDEN